jgi:hypothetical protein
MDQLQPPQFQPPTNQDTSPPSLLRQARNTNKTRPVLTLSDTFRHKPRHQEEKKPAKQIRLEPLNSLQVSNPASSSCCKIKNQSKTNRSLALDKLEPLLTLNRLPPLKHFDVLKLFLVIFLLVLILILIVSINSIFVLMHLIP